MDTVGWARRTCAQASSRVARDQCVLYGRLPTIPPAATPASVATTPPIADAITSHGTAIDEACHVRATGFKIRPSPGRGTATGDHRQQPPTTAVAPAQSIDRYLSSKSSMGVDQFNAKWRCRDRLWPDAIGGSTTRMVGRATPFAALTAPPTRRHDRPRERSRPQNAADRGASRIYSV